MLGVISSSPGEVRTCVPGDAGERGPHLRSQVRHADFATMAKLRMARDAQRAACTSPKLRATRCLSTRTRTAGSIAIAPDQTGESTSPMSLTEPAYAAAEPATAWWRRVPDVLVVPMLKDDDLVGAIVIYRQEVRPFTEKQIELVQNFAAQAVIAIENTRLLSECAAHRRSDGIAGAADRDHRGAQGHLQLAGRSGAGVRAMLENATRICEATFGAMLHLRR